MLFDNLKISRKLAIGFTAVTLTMAGMGCAMLANLRALDDARLEIKESRETLTALITALAGLAEKVPVLLPLWCSLKAAPALFLSFS